LNYIFSVVDGVEVWCSLECWNC